MTNKISPSEKQRSKQTENSCYQELSAQEIQELLSVDASHAKPLTERQVFNIVIGAEDNQD